MLKLRIVFRQQQIVLSSKFAFMALVSFDRKQVTAGVSKQLSIQGKDLTHMNMPLLLVGPSTHLTPQVHRPRRSCLWLAWRSRNEMSSILS